MREIFNLRSRLDAYETGVTETGQTILGMLFPWVVGVFFSSDGSFLEVEKRPLDVDATPRERFEPFVEARFAGIAAGWKKEIRFKEGPIRVRKFFLSDYRIGIRDLPLDLQDYEDNPNAVPVEDREEFQKDLDAWISERNFVFFWGADYHLNSDGETL